MHRTDFCTAGAVDALRTGLVFDVLFRQKQQTRTAFCRADSHRRLSESHHRATGYDFYVLFGQRHVFVECVVYELIRRTRPYPEVAGILHAASRYRHCPFVGRLTVINGARHRISRMNVRYDDADVRGKSAAGNFSSRHGVNQLFFRALRVFHLARRNGDVGIHAVGDKFFDRFRLVLFDTDKDVFRAEGLFQQQNACDEFIRLFKKKTIIAGDVRLALGGVYDKCVDVGFRRKFDVSRESRAAHADDTCFLNPVHDFFGRRVVQSGKRNFVVFFVVCDDNVIARSAGSGRQSHKSRNRARNGRKHVCGNKTRRFSDKLSFFDVIADVDDGFGRRTDVLRQRYAD